MFIRPDRLDRVAECGDRLVSARFVLFAMIGGIGVVTHLAILRLAIGAFGIAFPAGQAIAACAAMTGNFLLNNISTYRDRRLRGAALARGLSIYYGISGIGLAANVAVAALLFGGNHRWWAAGLGGAVAGSLWNYAMSSALVWRSPATALKQQAAAPTQAASPIGSAD